MRIRMIAGLAAAATLAMTAGCGGTGKIGVTAQGSASMPTSSADPTTSGAPFGPACASLPSDPSDPGRAGSTSTVPVGAAAAGYPQLSTLVTALTKVGLVDTLNNAQGVTVFAPTNDAFAKISVDDLNALLADQAQLTSVLTYHVVDQRLGPDQLAGSHPTEQGGRLAVTGGGRTFSINDTAMVVCGNIQTSNGTVYLVDSVLTPRG